MNGTVRDVAKSISHVACSVPDALPTTLASPVALVSVRVKLLISCEKVFEHEGRDRGCETRKAFSGSSVLQRYRQSAFLIGGRAEG